MSLPLRHALDPRPADQAWVDPLRDAVNIPLAELRDRTGELPSKANLLPVAASGTLLTDTLDALKDLGRTGVAVPVERPGEAGPGRLWSPNVWLEAWSARLEPGQMLDLGCGAGRDSVFMASLGWRVTGVDLLPDALERAGRLATFCQVDVDWETADVEALTSYRSGFDLVQAAFFFWPGLVEVARHALVPGGHLLVETFSPGHRLRTGSPRDANRVPDFDSLDLAGFDVVARELAMVGDREVVRAALRRIG